MNVTSTVSAPTVVGCDNFTGSSGATMSGRPARAVSACSSRVWTVSVGTWTIQSNRAASSSTPGAVVTQNTDVASSTVRAVLTGLNTGGRSGGLVQSHDGTNSYLAAVMIDAAPDRIELRLYSGGASSLLSTLNPSFASTNTLELTRNGAVISVALNGSALGSHTLDSSQLGVLGIGARAGLFGGHGSVRFDNFVVTVP